MADVPADGVCLPVPVIVSLVDIKFDTIEQQTIVVKHEMAIDDDPRLSGCATQSIEDVPVGNFKGRRSQYAAQARCSGTAMDAVDR